MYFGSLSAMSATDEYLPPERTQATNPPKVSEKPDTPNRPTQNLGLPTSPNSQPSPKSDSSSIKVSESQKTLQNTGISTISTTPTINLQRQAATQTIGASPSPSQNESGISAQAIPKDQSTSPLNWVTIGVVIAGVSIIAVIIAVLIIRRTRRRNVNGRSGTTIVSSKSSLPSITATDKKLNDWDHSNGFYASPQSSAYSVKPTVREFPTKHHDHSTPSGLRSVVVTVSNTHYDYAANQTYIQPKPKPNFYELNTNAVLSTTSINKYPTFEKLGTENYQISPLVFSPLNSTPFQTSTPEEKTVDVSFSKTVGVDDSFESYGVNDSFSSVGHNTSSETIVNKSDEHGFEDENKMESIFKPPVVCSYVASGPSVLMDALNSSDTTNVLDFRVSVHEVVFGKNDVGYLEDVEFEEDDDVELMTTNHRAPRYLHRSTLRPTSLSTIGEVSEANTSLARTHKSDSTW
ncbi:hypothetical protein HK098_007950 [Nowakowskiella sp. JEL0407]|nr:hypothetical protein HK098_007950 [Nowakowskiella sp. JEL0407]